jgi:hypothetical protein
MKKKIETVVLVAVLIALIYFLFIRKENVTKDDLSSYYRFAPRENAGGQLGNQKTPANVLQPNQPVNLQKQDPTNPSGDIIVAPVNQDVTKPVLVQ